MTRLGILFIILLFSVPALQAAQPELLSLQFTPAERILHVEAVLSQPATAHVFRLAHPARIVLDFKGVRMSPSLKIDGLPLPGVSRLRTGYPDKGMLRIVLDVEHPIQVQQRSSGRADRVQVDLFPFANKKTVASRMVSVSPVAEPEPLQRAVKRSAAPRPVTVVIDPGHGGHDPGARGLGGVREKNIVLSIAMRLADEINRTPGMRAVLTRKGDYFVPLRGRLHLARRGRGDLFVSIHADSWFERDASGASAYALSHHGATSEAARWLAGRENDSELAGVNLKDLGDQSAVLRSVLIDLAQTATIRDSLHLGSSILESLDTVTDLHYKHVEQAPFMVLKSPDIPSVLVETGFLSNTKEAMRLRSPAYQTRIAHAVFVGIRDYLKKYPPTSV